MGTFRQATIAGEQMENPVFTGPSDIYSVYWILFTLCTGFCDEGLWGAGNSSRGMVHDGVNRIATRTVNAFEITGPVSTAVVEVGR
jgi:hypothetical protein